MRVRTALLWSGETFVRESTFDRNRKQVATRIVYTGDKPVQAAERIADAWRRHAPDVRVILS